jgi:N-acetylmuramoyl-L-alanine amidase
MPSVLVVQCALGTYGYRIEITGDHDEQTFDIIRAFQMHFTPWQTNGEIDIETVSTLWALLEKYFPESFGDEGELLCRNN